MMRKMNVTPTDGRIGSCEPGQVMSVREDTGRALLHLGKVREVTEAEAASGFVEAPAAEPRRLFAASRRGPGRPRKSNSSPNAGSRQYSRRDLRAED